MSELNAPPPPPVLGDGSMEELRTLLWKTHGITVDQHDPILMTYTIHKVALSDFERLLDRYGRRLSEDTNEAATTFADDVRQSIENLKSQALTDAVRQRLTTIKETTDLTDIAYGKLKQTVRLLWALTAANYLAVAITLGVLAVLTD